MRRLNYVWGPRLMSKLRMRWVIFKNPHADIRFEGYCHLGKGFDLIMREGGQFHVGKHVDFRPGFRAEIAGTGRVKIGDLCVFSYHSLIQCDTTIEIGDRVMFGQSSIVVDGNHRLKNISTPIHSQGYDYRAVKIENDVTTLTKCTITHNIRTKAIVAANSVVAKEVPAYSLVGGVPAKMLDYFGPPELTPPEWETRRRERGIAAPDERPGRLEVSGHSIAFGGGVSAFEHRFTSRLAALLGIEERNRAVSGAVLCWPQSVDELGDGGWAHVLQEVTRPADLGASHPEPFTALVYYGVNDLALLGSANLRPFEHALRTVISRHRATAVFEDDHESVSYTGEWGPRAAAGPDCSGAGVRATTAAGAAVTIDVGDAFAGGAVALGFVAEPDVAARVEVEVDGAPAATLDLTGATDPLKRHRNGAVVRLPGLAPGAHAVTATVAATDGPVAFDYWQVEPEPGPLVLVPLAYLMRDWFYHYWDWPHEPKDEDIPILNDATRAVVAEFGPSVVAVDVEHALGKRKEMFSWENVYPNDDGHGAIAQALHAAAQKTGVSV